MREGDGVLLNKLRSEVNYMQTDIKLLKEHHESCNLQHQQHREYQEANNEALRGLTNSNLTLATSLNAVNETVKDFKPTLERARDEFTTRDTGLKWAASLGLLLGILLTLKSLFF